MTILRFLLATLLAIAIPAQAATAASVRVCSHHPARPALHGAEAKQEMVTDQVRDGQHLEKPADHSGSSLRATGSDKSQLHSTCKCGKPCCQPLAAFSTFVDFGYSPQVLKAASAPQQLLSWAEPVPHKPPKA